MTKRTSTTRFHLSTAFAFVWAVGIVLIGVLPLRNFVGHSHWEYIVWIPSFEQLTSRRNLFDMAANTTLYIPLGFSIARSLSGTVARRLGLTLGLAACLSMSIEFYQVYCHNRHPSILDIMTNTLGSVIGTTIAAVMPHGRQSASSLTPTPPARTLVP
jgi:glycopeptide antibiotics resistance protein